MKNSKVGVRLLLCLGIVAALCLWPSRAQGISGPIFPPDNPAFAVVSGGTFPFLPGGRTWTFSNASQSGSDSLYWGRDSSQVLGLSFNQVGVPPPLPVYAPSEQMSYNAGLSNLPQGIVVWSGLTAAPGSAVYNIPTFFRLTVTDTTGLIPLELCPANMIIGMNPNVGGALRIPNAAFTWMARLEFFAPGMGSPAGPYFDNVINPVGVPPQSFYSDVSNAFYHYNNTLPSISNIPDTATAMDTATPALPITVSDTENVADHLDMAGSSDNQTLIPDANIVFGGSGGARTVTITPAAGQVGTATITVTTTDCDGAAGVDTFVLFVGDPPPTISNLPDLLIQEDTSTGDLAITVGDLNTPVGSLTMSGTSSNTALVPNLNIVFGGAGANRTVNITPNTGVFGTTLITLTVSDGVSNTSDDFILTVNDQPHLDSNAGLLATEGGSSVFTGFAPPGSALHAVDGDNPDTEIFYDIVGGPSFGVVRLNGITTSTFTQQDLIDGLVTYLHDGSETTADQFQFSVRDADFGVASDMGFTVFTFPIVITAQNDPPVANDQVGSVGFGSTLTSTLSGSDPDVPVQVLTYSLTTPPAKGIVNITDVNTGAFTYTANPGEVGPDSFVWTLSDGTLSDTGTFSITIVNQPPVANAASISTVQQTLFSGTLTASDVDLPAQLLTYAIVNPGTKGVAVVTDASTGAFTYTPNAGRFGTDTFTFRANDGFDDSAPATITVTIRPWVNLGNIVVGCQAQTGGQPQPGRIVVVNPLNGDFGVLSSGGLLNSAFAVAVAADGTVYATDIAGFMSGAQAGRVIRVDRVTAAQSIVTSGLLSPLGIAIETDGNLLVTDARQLNGTPDGKLIRVDPILGTQTVLVDGALGAPFLNPAGVAVLANGNIVVGEANGFSGNAVLFVVDKTTNVPTPFSGPGPYFLPIDMEVEPSGQILLLDTNPFGGGGVNVWRVDPVTGAPALVTSGPPGISQSFGLALDLAGTIFVDTNGGTGSLVAVDPLLGVQTPLTTDSVLNGSFGVALFKLATQTTLISSANPSVYSAPVTFTATVAAVPPGVIPTGSVTFLNDGIPMGTVPLDAGGQAVLITAILTPGLHTIDALYSGDIGLAASQATPLLQSVFPEITVNDVAVVEGNGGATLLSFTATLSAAMPFDVTVDFATADATATVLNLDYAALTGTLTIPANTLSASFQIQVNGDVLNEPDEIFLVNLTNPVNGVLARTQVVGTIINDDSQPTLSVSDAAAVNEANAGVIPAQFTVTLSAASAQTVTVSYATQSGTALAGVDFVQTSGVLTFLPGEVTKTVDVPILDDGVDEPVETFVLNLFNPVNAGMTDAQGDGSITDNDPPPLISIGNASGNEGDAGTSNLIFNVTLSNPSALPVTVNFVTADGTATAASGDYLPTGGTLTFLPGETLKILTVTVNGDVVNEANETFLVNLSAPGNAGIAQGTGMGTIVNDDPLPVLTINSPASVVEGNQITFTVTLTPPSGQTVTVAYATSGNTATSGADFTPDAGSLTFVPGATTQTVTINTINDATNEAAETFFVTLLGSVNAVLGVPQGTGTITDNDAVPGLTVAGASVKEGNVGPTILLFPVTLSNASSQTVTVNFTTADGTATLADNDYATSAGTLTFLPGEMVKTIPVTVNGDAVNEADETITVTLSGPTNATLTTAAAIGTIVNDDGVSSLSIDSPAGVVEGNNIVFTVTLAPSSAQTVTVNYVTAGNTALSGADFTPAAGTLTFAPGVTTQQITVATLDDAIDEPLELFFVQLSNPVNAVIGTAQGTGTITDNDAPPTVSIANASGTEGNAGTTNLLFTVTLSNGSDQTVTVNYATSDGTATTANLDYVSAAGTLTFLPGETVKTIAVAVNGDAVNEADETFLVTLSVPVNVGLGTSTGTGTIVNDDALPALSVNSPAAAVEGNTVTFTVTLTPASAQTVTVAYATAGNTATSGADFTPAAGTLTFAPGATTQTVVVTTIDDATDEPVETFFLLLSNPTNATVSVAQGTGTITDADSGPSISITGPVLVEGNSGTVLASFDVVLSSASQQTVTVDFATADVTALAGSDYTTTNGTLTFLPGETFKTVLVSVNGDVQIEEDETFRVTLTNPTNASVSVAQALATILNDDVPPPVMQVTPADGFSSVGAGPGSYTPPSKTYTVTNLGFKLLAWKAEAAAPWLQVVPSSGVLGPLDSIAVQVSIVAAEADLLPGIPMPYSDVVRFINLTDGLGSTTRPAVLAVAGTSRFRVEPESPFVSSGPSGGPFSLPQASFTLSKTGGGSVNWTASTAAPWLTLSATSGTLGAKTTLTVTLNAAANALAPGEYVEDIVLTNLGAGGGSTTRTVKLVVFAGDPPALTLAPAPPATVKGTQVLLGGAVTDDGTVQVVAWSNASTGDTGVASIGGGVWTATVPLVKGINVITITAFDDFGNFVTVVVRLICKVGGASSSNAGYCGLVGFEGVLPVGLIWLFRLLPARRRRKGSR